MKHLVIIIAAIFINIQVSIAQDRTTSKTDWFEDARFGMFIHFGASSLLGSGEWVMNSRPVSAHSYMRLQDLFDPEQFDAAEWVSVAKNAGMKYMVLTSRHHDGFSNWDTKQSDWNIMNTPYGKDLIKQLAEECQRQDIKLGFYYSTLDWMREDYPWTTGRTGQKSGRDSSKIDMDSYFEFMKAQLTELLTNYGPISIIWLDGHWDQCPDENRTSHETNIDWRYPELYAHIRSLQPDCLIANNHHIPPFPGEDYQIFERDVPGENKAGYSGQDVSRLPLETCQTISESWGFRITDEHFKSTKELLQLLIRTSGTGANLLLNVGPMPNGKIQPECVDRLIEMGKWMEKYGYTLYETQQGFSAPEAWGASTRSKDGKTYYIHILESGCKSLTINIPNIKSAEWVNIDSKLSWKKDRKTGNVTFDLSETNLDDIDSIIVVRFK